MPSRRSTRRAAFWDGQSSSWSRTSANDVGTGVQKTRKLIERDQVSFIIGDVNSGIAIAMAQVTSEKKVLHIVSGGHTDPITGSSCSWNVFRVCNSTTMDATRSPPR